MATGTAPGGPPPARDYHTKQVHYVRGTLGFGTGSSASATIGTIPASSSLIEAWVICTVAFNAGSGNQITVGNVASAAAYATINAGATAGNFTVGRKVGTTLVSAAGATLMPTADTVITATFTGVGAAASTGSAEVVVEYDVV